MGAPLSHLLAELFGEAASPPSQEELLGLVEEAVRLIDSLKKGDFPPNPRKGPPGGLGGPTDGGGKAIPDRPKNGNRPLSSRSLVR